MAAAPPPYTKNDPSAPLHGGYQQVPTKPQYGSAPPPSAPPYQTPYQPPTQRTSRHNTRRINLYQGLCLLLLQSHLFTGIECVKPPIWLSNNAQNLSTVSRGESLIFTCVTIGSLIIAWSSEEYLARGGSQLSLLSIDPPGTIVNSTISASFINLTMVDTVNGDVVLESQLHIVDASVDSTVTCYNNDLSINESITFSVATESASTDSTTAVTQRPITTDQSGPTPIPLSYIIAGVVVAALIVIVAIVISIIIMLGMVSS